MGQLTLCSRRLKKKECYAFREDPYGLPASLPLSIGTVAPVMKDAWSLQSHAARNATSSGVPIRRIGTACSISDLSFNCLIRSFRIGPGAIALTLMFICA